jgi:hypothetical protein
VVRAVEANTDQPWIVVNPLKPWRVPL